MTVRTLLLFCAALGLGCTQAGDRQQIPNTVLLFKHGPLSGNGAVLSELLRAFEQGHPGVIVREELLPSSSDRQHQYYAMNLDGGRAPFDLLGVDTIWVQEFAKAKWISPLDAYLPLAEREQFFSGPIQAATFEGRLYAVPWYIDAGVLYYRRDLLERHGVAPPTTWPDLVLAAQLILDAEGDPRLAGFVWQGKQYEGLVCVALEVLRSNGSDLWGGDRARAEAGLQFLRETVAGHRITPVSVGMADEESTRQLFGSGRALFMRNWPYAWPLFQQEGSLVRGKVGIAPLPSFPGYPSAPVLGGWMLAAPQASSHQQEVGELIRFLTSPDAQRLVALEMGYNPTRRALYSEKSLIEARPLLKDLYPIFLEARPRPVTPYYLLLSQALQPEVSAVVVGRKTPREALDAVRRQVTRILGGRELPRVANGL
ncbi:MAG: ABC transporter substrate-binding protein [Nitrospira sp.]|nr:ABC transporter substrate-binding protein [Nitrospira sp.]